MRSSEFSRRKGGASEWHIDAWTRAGRARGAGRAQVHKQAAQVVRKLLAAQEAGKGGASLKSLTLAPAILAKKATHAICCETLKCACAAPRV
jgi:hypothetical protein